MKYLVKSSDADKKKRILLDLRRKHILIHGIIMKILGGAKSFLFLLSLGRGLKFHDKKKIL